MVPAHRNHRPNVQDDVVPRRIIIWVVHVERGKSGSVRGMAQTSRSNPAIGGAVPTQYDVMLALARKIVNGEEEDEAETAVFAQARDAEAVAEEYLVDDGWKLVDVEPEAVQVNDNGNGHHDANGIGPTVELVLGNNGHAEAVVNGNGRHDEAPEPQQSLFSWAEFMAEEPVKPKGRGRKPQPATASLFDWALTLQRGREEEPVGLPSR